MRAPWEAKPGRLDPAPSAELSRTSARHCPASPASRIPPARPRPPTRQTQHPQSRRQPRFAQVAPGGGRRRLRCWPWSARGGASDGTRGSRRLWRRSQRRSRRRSGGHLSDAKRPFGRCFSHSRASVDTLAWGDLLIDEHCDTRHLGRQQVSVTSAHSGTSTAHDVQTGQFWTQIVALQRNRGVHPRARSNPFGSGFGS